MNHQFVAFLNALLAGLAICTAAVAIFQGRWDKAVVFLLIAVINITAIILLSPYLKG